MAKLYHFEPFRLSMDNNPACVQPQFVSDPGYLCTPCRVRHISFVARNLILEYSLFQEHLARLRGGNKALAIMANKL